MTDDFDTESARYRLKQREEFGLLGCLLGEVLFYRERREAGWPLARTTDATPPASLGDAP